MIKEFIVLRNVPFKEDCAGAFNILSRVLDGKTLYGNGKRVEEETARIGLQSLEMSILGRQHIAQEKQSTIHISIILDHIRHIIDVLPLVYDLLVAMELGDKTT